MRRRRRDEPLLTDRDRQLVAAVMAGHLHNAMLVAEAGGFLDDAGLERWSHRLEDDSGIVSKSPDGP